MALFMDSTLVEVALGIITVLCGLVFYVNRKFNFWRDQGVPYVRPHPIFGSAKDMVFQTRNVFEIQQETYNQLEGERFGGFYQFFKPFLLIREPELIDRVLIKDFSHFVDRGFGDVDPERDPLSTGLSVLTGQQWRHLRYKLTPTFTSGKLKGMFEQICNCGNDLLKELEDCAQKGEGIETKTVLNLFTTDVIATIAFGLQFGRNDEAGNTFRKMAGKLFAPSRIQMLKFFILIVTPKLAKLLRLPIFGKDVSDYFIELTKRTIKYREENKVDRNDFLQLLLTLRDQEKSGKTVDIQQELKGEDEYLKQADYTPSVDSDNIELTDKVIAAQSFLFISAGSEGVSSSTSLSLFYIATHPTIQRKVHEEVDATLKRHNGWSYSALKDMIYLDQVIQESMRIAPFTPNLQRVCTIPYKIPGTDVVVKKGQTVIIPVYPLHKDPCHYPDPDVFDPERFKGNNYRQSKTYLPFGDGPRMCIAMRFAVFEMKVCLAKVLSQFSVSLNKRTTSPLVMDPRSFLPIPKDGIWLNFHKRAPNTDSKLI